MFEYQDGATDNQQQTDATTMHRSTVCTEIHVRSKALVSLQRLIYERKETGYFRESYKGTIWEDTIGGD